MEHVYYPPERRYICTNVNKTLRTMGYGLSAGGAIKSNGKKCASIGDLGFYRICAKTSYKPNSAVSRKLEANN